MVAGEVPAEFAAGVDDHLVGDAGEVESLGVSVVDGGRLAGFRVDGKIIGYFNSHDRIDGYAAVRMQGTNLYVDELVYLDSVSLVKLLNACLAERPYVHFHTSGAENLDPMFPNAQKKKYDSVMVRINNYELFNKVFGTDATNVTQALSVSKKPLNMNESY